MKILDNEYNLTSTSCGTFNHTVSHDTFNFYYDVKEKDGRVFRRAQQETVPGTVAHMPPMAPIDDFINMPPMGIMPPIDDFIQTRFGWSIEISNEDKTGYCITAPNIIQGPFLKAELDECINELESACGEISKKETAPLLPLDPTCENAADFQCDSIDSNECNRYDTDTGKFVFEHCRKSCQKCTCTRNDDGARSCCRDDPNFVFKMRIEKLRKKRTEMRCKDIGNNPDEWMDLCSNMKNVARNCPMKCRKCIIQLRTR